MRNGTSQGIQACALWLGLTVLGIVGITVVAMWDPDIPVGLQVAGVIAIGVFVVGWILWGMFWNASARRANTYTATKTGPGKYRIRGPRP